VAQKRGTDQLERFATAWGVLSSPVLYLLEIVVRQNAVQALLQAETLFFRLQQLITSQH
jgi:hypothetical protein